MNADVERARAAVQQMRDQLAAEPGTADDPELRYLAAVIRLVEMAADDAAAVERMNERSRQRAERAGGGDHTWAMHRPEWTVALQAVDAWEEGHRG